MSNGLPVELECGNASAKIWTRRCTSDRLEGLYVRPPITIRAMAKGSAARRRGHKSCWGHCRSGELFLQLGAGLSNLGRHQRAVLNLKENTFGLLAIARCSFLHLLVNGERILSHCLALLNALHQLCAHPLDLFRRRFVFADNGFRRQLADFRSSLPVLDIIGYRGSRRAHPWRHEIDRTLTADWRTVPDFCLNLLFQIGNVASLSRY